MSDETQATGQDAPVDTTAAATATTQPSEASETNKNEAPEATQEQAEVKETKAPETKAEETAEEKLYAGKYKTVEDLENAYKSASSEASKISQERAELTKILNEAFATDAAEPAGAADDSADDFQEESPYVNPETDQLKKDNAVIKFMLSHEGADPEAMKQVLTADPMMNQIQGYEAKLEYAFLRSQNMSQPKAIAEAEKKGAEKAQAKTAEKQVAQVEQAAKTAEQVDENSELYGKATGNYSKQERDDARRKFIRKNLVNL